MTIPVSPRVRLIPRRRAITCILALAIAAAVTITGVGAAPSAQASSPKSWSPAVDLSTGPESSLQPRVAVSPSGDASAVWRQTVASWPPSDYPYTLMSRTKSPGGSWGAAIDLSAGYLGLSTPLIVVDPESEQMAAAWGYTGFGMEVIQVRTRESGGSWGPVATLSLNNGNSTLSHLEFTPQGELIVMWTRSGAIVDGGRDRVESRVRGADGNWGDIEQLSTPGLFGFTPLLAVSPDGDAMAVWNEGSDTRFSTRAAGQPWSNSVAVPGGAAIYLNQARLVGTATGEFYLGWTTGSEGTVTAVVRSAAGVWSSPTEITSNSVPVDYWNRSLGGTRVVSDNTGRIAVAWSTVSRAVMVRERSASGVWGQVLNFGSGSSPQMYARLDGDLLLVYTRPGNVGAQVVTRTRDEAGWSAVTTISNDEGAERPIIVASAGGEMVVWTSPEAPARVGSSVRGGDGAWSPAVEIAANAYGPSSAQIGMSDAGTAVAVWSVTSSYSRSLVTRTSTFSAAPSSGLVGVGPMQTEDVIAGIASSVPTLTPYRASGSSQITTRVDGLAFARPRSSEAAQVALSTSLVSETLGGTPIGGYVDFAISTIGPSTALPGADLTFIPFARDAVSFAVNTASDIPRDIALGSADQDASSPAPFTLRNIYRGVITSFVDADLLPVQIRPMLPAAGTELRAFWLEQLGLTEATIGASVVSVGPGVREDDSSVVTGAGDILPLSVSSYIAQGNHAVLPTSVIERRGMASLGSIGTVKPFVTIASRLTSNPDFPVSRLVYSVVETNRVAGASFADEQLATAFVGSNALVCAESVTIAAYGYADIGSQCGVPLNAGQGLRLD